MRKPIPDTKQRLIDTAFDLIWKSSYGSVSVDDICKAADVKKGSFYHFFPSKVDLAIAAMDKVHQAMKPVYDGIFSSATPALMRFEKLADYIYESQKETSAKYGRVCGCPCASLGSEMAGLEDGIRIKFDEFAGRSNRYYESAVRDLMAEGNLPANTDAKAKAQEISAYLMGQMMTARIQNDLEPLRRNLKSGLLGVIGVSEKQTEAA